MKLNDDNHSAWKSRAEIHIQLNQNQAKESKQ